VQLTNSFFKKINKKMNCRLLRITAGIPIRGEEEIFKSVITTPHSAIPRMALGFPKKQLTHRVVLTVKLINKKEKR
jgi:hypothetical protein